GWQADSIIAHRVPQVAAVAMHLDLQPAMAPLQPVADGILHQRLQQQPRDAEGFHPRIDLDLEGELTTKALGHHCTVTPNPTHLAAEWHEHAVVRLVSS